MEREFEILTGPAGSGKTPRCLEEYREVLRASLGTGRPAEVLWITPTEHSRRAVTDALLDDSLPVCFAPNVFTFERFAERVLESSASDVQRLDPAVKRRLLRQLIDDRLQNRRLQYFAPIAPTTGFLDLVESFIAELKRAEIWPDEFAEVCRRLNDRRKDRELAELYQAYQDRLQETGLFDSEGQIWSARDVLQREGAGPFSGRELLVVDGFTDFSRTQQEILALLAGDCARMMVTLPVDTPSARTELFAKSTDSLQQLTAELRKQGSVRRTALDGASVIEQPAIRQISGALFQNPREISPSDDAAGLTILAVTGTNAEIDVLAGRVKALLLSGTEPADIVVALRLLEEHADLIRSRFTAAGIPFWMSHTRPLNREPLVRALFEVLRMEMEDWPFERVKAVLHSNYFRPGWNLDDLHGRVTGLLLRLRKEKLHSQRRIMRKVLRREARRAKERIRDGTRRKDDDAVIRAEKLFQRLDHATAALRSKSDFSGWVKRLVELARELGIAAESPSSQDDSSLEQRDREVWERLQDVLFDAGKADAIAGTAERAMSLPEFVESCRELLQTQRRPPTDARRGRVRVLEAGEVRNLDVPHLFLAGLTERSFPRAGGDDCLYLERERRELRDAGLQVRHRVSQSQDEMLLFYGIVTRARQTLTLSYAKVGANGEPLFCSPYVTAIRQLFDSDTLPETQAGGLDPLPDRDALLTPADWRNVAVEELRHSRPALFAALSATPDGNRTAVNILAGIDANCARFETTGWTPYDGNLQDGGSLQRLADRFPPDHQFSVSQFEEYAGCRFRFLLSGVLGIEPLEPPTVATDHRRRGSVIHKVLAEVHRELTEISAEKARESQPVGLQELTQLFRDRVAEQLGRRITDTELARALTKIEGRLFEEWAETYAEHWEAYRAEFAEHWEAPPQPTLFERGFGKARDEDGTSDEPNEPPVIFGDKDQKTYVCGRIDRIDVGTADGTPVFNVIDYKTGRLQRFSLEQVQSGKAIQLALYSLAVKRLGLAGPEAQPYQMGFWSLRETGFASGLKGRRKRGTAIDEAVLQTFEKTLDELIPRLAAGMRRGDFPVDSDDPHCTQRCPYRTVCRITQLRPVQERLQKTRMNDYSEPD